MTADERPPDADRQSDTIRPPDAIDVRPVGPDDWPAVDAVLRVAFEDATEAELVAALRDCGAHREDCSLVAADERSDAVVGYVGFADVTVEGGATAPAAATVDGEATAQNATVVVLAPLAVVPERQREGIGTRLVEAGLDRCRTAGVDGVVLEGDPDFYGRVGFRPARAFGLVDGHGAQPPVFQARACRPGGLDGVAGAVRYPDPFDAL